ncbi:MAG TPA: hypothetical protein VMT82_01015 [candidate division Zixibacteria bacterium]|nr:hypothetical protein [candidate division Zixibacteria bacterium]
MKRLVALVVLLLVPALYAGSPGSFRGIVVNAPKGQASAGWIYLRGANGMVRRVSVTNAAVTYDAKFPAGQRLRRPEASLIAGADVRVTAEISSDGEWRASRVEILGKRRVQVDDDPDDDDDSAPPIQRVALRTI